MGMNDLRYGPGSLPGPFDLEEIEEIQMILYPPAPARTLQRTWGTYLRIRHFPTGKDSIGQ